MKKIYILVTDVVAIKNNKKKIRIEFLIVKFNLLDDVLEVDEVPD